MAPSPARDAPRDCQASSSPGRSGIRVRPGSERRRRRRLRRSPQPSDPHRPGGQRGQQGRGAARAAPHRCGRGRGRGRGHGHDRWQHLKRGRRPARPRQLRGTYAECACATGRAGGERACASGRGRGWESRARPATPMTLSHWPRGRGEVAPSSYWEKRESVTPGRLCAGSESPSDLSYLGGEPPRDEAAVASTPGPGVWGACLPRCAALPELLWFPGARWHTLGTMTVLALHCCWGNRGGVGPAFSSGFDVTHCFSKQPLKV